MGKAGRISGRPSKEKLIEALGQGNDQYRAAEILGVSAETITRWRGEYDMRRRITFKRDDLIKDIEEVKRLYLEEGWLQVDIAKKWKCSPASVSQIFKQIGIKK